MDALGRVWDLRTGRCVYVMKGHVKPVLAIDFHPDWYVRLEAWGLKSVICYVTWYVWLYILLECIRCMYLGQGVHLVIFQIMLLS